MLSNSTPSSTPHGPGRPHVGARPESAPAANPQGASYAEVEAGASFVQAGFF